MDGVKTKKNNIRELMSSWINLLSAQIKGG